MGDIDYKSLIDKDFSGSSPKTVELIFLLIPEEVYHCYKILWIPISSSPRPC